jgi:hypothetical protein
LVDGTIQVRAFSFDVHVGLIASPASTYPALMTAELILNLWDILDHPPIEGGMITHHTPLAHHLFQVPVGNRISDVPSNAPQNDSRSH